MYTLNTVRPGYDIRAVGHELANGKFAPMLTITVHSGSHTDDVQVRIPPPEEFDTDYGAAVHALTHGVEWAEGRKS